MKKADYVTMSGQELDRLEVLQRVLEKRLTQVEAGIQLGISSRQVRRLVTAIRTQGPPGVVSRKRGGFGNRSRSETDKKTALQLIAEHYSDFGPTLIAEKLAEKHDLRLSRETIRRWLIEADLWKTRTQRQQRAYQPRYRRECFGELIQIDGSDHHWFEDRAPRCTLLVYIDDATGQLLELRFTASKTTLDYFYSTRRYLENYGKPVAFYSDKHTVFRVNKHEAKTGTGLTQFGRALHELNIDIIYANSSQAKGRVERMNQTLQDRLVKELRLANISTIDEGNAFLPGFMAEINAKFAKEPLNPTNMHRALSELDNLSEILCWQEKRKVSDNLTLQYDRVMYLLEDNVFSRMLKRKRVTVFDYPDGQLAIKYDNRALPYSVFYDKATKIITPEVVSNKRLGAVLQFAKEQQEANAIARSKKSPTRRGQQLIHDQQHRKKNPALA